MIITPNAGLLAANIQLTAINGPGGSLIQKPLQWTLLAASNKARGDASSTYTKMGVKVSFTVPAGKYLLKVYYNGTLRCQDMIELVQNALHNLVYVIGGLDDAQVEYFADYDPNADWQRRQQERESQRFIASAAWPLRDPDSRPQGEMGVQIMAHPLLSKSVQFDGVPPEFRPDPSENTAALRLSLENQLQNNPQAQPSVLPKPGH